MEMRKEDISVNKTVFETECSILAECDTIVPDTKPDLLKVLQLDASVRVLKKEILNGKISISGMMDYKILYVPDSAKGVCGLSASKEFNHIEECQYISEGMFLDVECEVEHIEFNLLNSRKITVKSVASAFVTVTDKLMIAAPAEIEGDYIETSKRNFSALSRAVMRDCEIIIDDQIPVPPGKSSIGEILKSDVSVRNKDIKIISGKVVAKGEVVICCLYVPENGEGVTFVEHSMPFTEILDVEGINEDFFNSTDFTVAHSNIVKAYDSDGDARMLDCNVKLNVNIISDEILHTSIIDDAYSTHADLQINSENYEIDELKENIATAVTVKEAIVPAEGIPTIMHVYNVVAKPYVASAVFENGKIKISGSVDTYILYISGKEDSPVFSFKTDLPFSFEVDSDCNSGKIKTKISVNHISYNLNAAGEIEVRLSLNAEIRVFALTNVNIINSVEEAELEDREIPSIVLYFVQENDNLWNIAKRYHTKASYIEELNNIENDGLKEGMQLLIPKS